MIECKIYSPGGNTTALVEGVFPPHQRVSISKSVLAACPHVEQVGFVAPEPFHGEYILEMMGGEFCLNAARSVAAMLMRERGLFEIVLRVSGFSSPIKLRTSLNLDVEAVIPTGFVHSVHFSEKSVQVDLSGIRYFVSRNPHTLPLFEDLKADSCHSNMPALGAVLVTGAGEVISIEPTIWVKETDTLYKESGCGSGSVAAVLACGMEGRSVEVFQPSGSSYQVKIESNNYGINTVSVLGVVKHIEDCNIEV